MSSQYPALKADLDGDGRATVAEFGGGLGHQATRQGVAVSETSVTVAEGGEATYTVALNSPPMADVVVALASGDDSAATVAPPQLRFTTGDWSTAQVVTVRGVNDVFDNAGDRRTTVITHTVVSTDPGYHDIAAPRLAVAVADDDTAALALSVNPATLAEDGNAAEVTVRATLSGSMPDYDLELRLMLGGTARVGADYKVSSELPTITVTQGDASAQAVLTLTPLDDAVAEGEETITISVAHAGLGAPAQVTLTDKDTAAGLALSVSPKTLAEVASAANVTVTATLTSVNNSGSAVVLPLNFAGSAARGVDYEVSGPAAIRIAEGAGKGATTLTLTPTDDFIDEGLGEAIEIRTVHNNKQVAATLLLTDDDAVAPALSIEMAAGYSGTDPIPVRFVFPEPVTDFVAGGGVTVAGGTLGALSTQDGGRTYASAVTPDDSLPDAVTVEVGANAVTDRSGNTGPAAPVAATANRRGVAVAPQSMTVAEGGTAAYYTVALTSAPAGDVTVTVASGDTVVAAVEPALLRFTPDNWGTAQAVTVRGVADADSSPEQKRTAEVAHTASGADYAGVAAPAVTVTVINKIDYDADNDGLIEITKLEQLNAMRWDTDGDGGADVSGNDAAYAAAFPDPAANPGRGSGALGCSNGLGAAAACTGYELKANLDFKDNGSYANALLNKAGWTSSFGWEPVGNDSGHSRRFRTSFDGNGHAVANLFINRPFADHVGLFGVTHSSGARIRKVGLTDVNVTGRNEVGALAGRHFGTLWRCYASGRVAGGNDVGGLVGINGWDNKQGSIHGSFAAVAVLGNERLGGLVGRHYGVMVSASYAAGAVSGSGSEWGALIGRNQGSGNRIEAVYATGEVAGSGSSGGLTGNIGGPSASASYWDTQTTGQGSSGRGLGKTTAELQTPIDYGGIYAAWNVDVDGDGSPDAPWSFGNASEYPALKADFDGDGTATVGEFGGWLGHQLPRRDVLLSETSVTVPENGGTETYKVVLASAPVAPVVVALASGDDSAATVLPPELTFTTSDWDTEQTVTVTGVNDGFDNIDDRRTTLLRHTVTSTDADYHGITVSRLTVAVTDDDVAALALSVVPETLAEGGNAAAVKVTATLSGSMPDRDLELPLVLGGTARAGVDYTVSAELPAITIAGGTAAAEATLTLTPLDDAVAEGEETIAIGVVHAKFGVTAPAQLALTDNDDAGLRLALDRTTLAETDSATEVTVTATLSSVNNSGLEVVLPLNFSGSAARGVDYTLSGTGSIRISAGASAGTTRLTITPTDDAIDEGPDEIIEIGTAHKGNKVAVALLLTDDDAGAPALSIEMAAGYAGLTGYAGTGVIPVRFVFPEPVTGFASDDVTVSGSGTLGALSTQDGGRTYLSKVTPDGTNRAITVTVRRDAVIDRSGNTGPAAPVVKTALYDATVPTLVIEGLPTAFHGTEPLVLVFRFSEPIEFGSGDIEVSNGQVTGFSGDGAVHEVEVTPSGGGGLGVGLKPDAVADGAGNAVAPATVTAEQADGALQLSRTLVRTLGRYLHSLDGHVLPADMVVQGAEVHYRASLPDGSPLDANSVAYRYAFVRKQGDVKFLAQDDDGDTAANRFRADGYGENLIEVTATDGNGSKATVLDTVLVHFSSSRLLGGDAENLPDSIRRDMATNIDRIHDLTRDPPGMAYLPDNCEPADCPRGDTTTREIQKGFYLTKAPRTMITSQGTLLTALVGIRMSGAGEGTPREVNSGSGIVVARSDDHGVTWKTQLVIQEDKEVWGYTSMAEVENVVGDDGIARDTVYLYISGGHFLGSEAPGVSQKRRGTYYLTSTDDGRTWSSEPQRHDDIYKLTFTGSYLTPNPSSQGGNIPKGHQPSINLLHVPGLTLDDVVAPAGRGLLMHTYEEGYLFASVNGGVNWSKVAKYNGCTNVNMMNEIAWAVLPNDNGDIYMMFRRNAQTGYNLEYVITKEGAHWGLRPYLPQQV